MKFDCEGNWKNEWHKWFAWYPVNIEGYCYWLQYVERKRYFYTTLEVWKLMLMGVEKKEYMYRLLTTS